MVIVEFPKRMNITESENMNEREKVKVNKDKDIFISQINKNLDEINTQKNYNNITYNTNSRKNGITNNITDNKNNIFIEKYKDKKRNQNFLTEKEFKELLYPILDNNLIQVKKKLKSNFTYEIIKNRYFELIFDKDFAKYLTKHIYLDILYNEEKYKKKKDKSRIKNIEAILEENEKQIKKGINFKNLDYAAKSNEYFLTFGIEHIKKREKVLSEKDLFFRLKQVYLLMANYFIDYFYMTEYIEEIIFGYKETNKYLKEKDFNTYQNNIIPVKFINEEQKR